MFKKEVEECDLSTQLIEEALSLGISKKELLEYLPGLEYAIDNVRINKSYSSFRSKFGYFIAALILIICFIGLSACGYSLYILLGGTRQPVQKLQDKLSEVTFNTLQLLNYDPIKVSCIVDEPSWFSNFIRPISNCDFCKNLKSVPQVTKISKREFTRRFAYTSVPVLIKDGAANWTAPEVFSYKYFKSLYKDSGIGEKCQFFGYQTDFDSVEDLFQMSEAEASVQNGSTPWYVGWSNCDARVGNELRKHYQRPYFLPANSEPTYLDWIFMGKPGYGANMHIDNVLDSSWQAQIHGEKTWFLIPPLECLYKCSALNVTVRPGQLLVLDTNIWYHSTHVESAGMSIAIGAEYD